MLPDFNDNGDTSANDRTYDNSALDNSIGNNNEILDQMQQQRVLGANIIRSDNSNAEFLQSAGGFSSKMKLPAQPKYSIDSTSVMRRSDSNDASHEAIVAGNLYGA